MAAIVAMAAMATMATKWLLSGCYCCLTAKFMAIEATEEKETMAAMATVAAKWLLLLFNC